MKKFLSIFNILSFLFVSYIIFVEEFITENDIFPSFLYKRAEKLGSVFEYYTNPLLDIILTYISVVILSVLIFIILLFLRKVKRSFYILSTVCNLIITIPIFNMYNYALAVNPFGFLEYDRLRDYMLPWELCIYSCILSGILLAMYLIFKRTRHLFKETTLRKAKKISLISISLFFAFYFLNMAYLSFKSNYLINLAFNNNGEYNESLKNTISKELFERLDYGDGYLKGKGEITEEHNNTFPISYWYRNKAYSAYRFTYKKTDSIEGNLGGAYKVRAKITWEFKNFRWVITDVFVHP